MLFINMVWLAFCNLKDIIFLFDGLWEDPYLTGIAVTTDLLYVPIMSSFFLEVVSPGSMTGRRVLLPVCLQALFIPAYAAFPLTWLYETAIIMAYGYGAIMMVVVCILAVRHRRYILDNYSYTEYIDVSWTVWGGVSMFVCMTVYLFAFTDETWLGNAIYYAISFIAWTYLYILSRKHRVVELPPGSVFVLPFVRNEEEPSETEDSVLSDVYDVVSVCI